MTTTMMMMMGAAGIPAIKDWSALMVRGQTVVLSSHGAVASPSHGGVVTAACTVAHSYIQASSRESGEVAKLMAATRKEAKYSMLAGTHIFQHLSLTARCAHIHLTIQQ